MTGDLFAKFFIPLGIGLIVLVVVFIVTINYMDFQNHVGKTITCFNENTTLFEIEQTNDFVNWMNGYNRFYMENGLRVVSKEGTAYFCSENWMEE